MEAKAPSVAKTVHRYIDRHPVVRDAMRMGIVNLSALTRRIETETGITHSEAILVACRRYKAPDVRNQEERIREVLEGGKLDVRTRVVVWTLRPSWRLFSRLEKGLPRVQGDTGPVHVLHGSQAVTLIADESTAVALEASLEPEDISSKREGLVEVNLRTQERIEDVPGILAFVSSALAARGVNFVDVISCHKDNMFLITEDDLFTAFEVLNDLIRR